MLVKVPESRTWTSGTAEARSRGLECPTAQLDYHDQYGLTTHSCSSYERAKVCSMDADSIWGVLQGLYTIWPRRLGDWRFYLTMEPISVLKEEVFYFYTSLHSTQPMSCAGMLLLIIYRKVPPLYLPYFSYVLRKPWEWLSTGYGLILFNVNTLLLILLFLTLIVSLEVNCFNLNFSWEYMNMFTSVFYRKHFIETFLWETSDNCKFLFLFCFVFTTKCMQASFIHHLEYIKWYIVCRK